MLIGQDSYSSYNQGIFYCIIGISLNQFYKVNW